MISIDETTYREVANLLYRALGDRHFFNGTVAHDTEEFASALTCTLILCREAGSGRLLSVLPVWWEFHLYQAVGEVLTDFSWSELDPHLAAFF